MYNSRHIDKPIFILGSGRSGTTILYNLLSLHPSVFWFSTLTDTYPRLPILSFFHKIRDVPFFRNRIIRSQCTDPLLSVLAPAEGRSIYKRCGFIDDRKLTIKDLTPTMKNNFLSVVEWHQHMTGKSRFLNKRTANVQRIEPLLNMFPDAYWVHIIRDGRAVVNSLSHVDWWGKMPLWWSGRNTEEYIRDGYDPLLLCAEHWKHNINEIRSHGSKFENRYIEIHYEDLIHNPRKLIREIIVFCHLEADTEYLQTIPQVLPNMNVKWKKELSINQIWVVENEIGSLLSSLGYK